MAKFKVGDKVRILDGSKIENYHGGWAYKMKEFVGKVFTIDEVVPGGSWSNTGYCFKENTCFIWDERGLELEREEITITRHGNKVIAKLGEKVGVAKCSPDDTFDFAVGAKLAFSRLMGEPEDKPEPKRKFKIGEFVKVIGNECPFHNFPLGSIVVIMDINDDKAVCYGLAEKFGRYSFCRQTTKLNNFEHLTEKSHAD